MYRVRMFAGSRTTTASTLDVTIRPRNNSHAAKHLAGKQANALANELRGRYSVGVRVYCHKVA